MVNLDFSSRVGTSPSISGKWERLPCAGSFRKMERYPDAKLPGNPGGDLPNSVVAKHPIEVAPYSKIKG